jgi:protein SCO1/2
VAPRKLTTRRAWLRDAAAPPAGPPTPRERIRDRHLPNVSLRTHENRLVRFYDDLVKDKVVVINFMYAECAGICPGITINLARVQKLFGRRMGRDIFMYSISLEPQHDTPAVIAEYMRAHGVGRGWTFLTGASADVERLRQSLGFVDPDPDVDKDKENHIGNIRYGNEPLMLWAACPGMADAKWIVESISWVIRPT